MGSLTGKKILMIVAGKDFHDEEFFQTRVVLQGSGASVLTAALGTEEATGIKNGKARIDLDLAKIGKEEFDAFILIGGKGMQKLVKTKQLQQLILRADKENRLIAAISEGILILDKAGLKQKKNLILIKDSRQIEEFAENIKSFLNN